MVGSQYLAWLRNSRPGRAEAARLNNHGTWHDVQIAALATSLGLNDLARSTVKDSQKRITQQFNPDGSQPHELSRSKSFEYSLYNLEAWHHLAILGQRHGINLWTHRSENGASPASALDYLQKHLDHWPHPQLQPPSANALAAFHLKLRPTDTPTPSR